MQSQHSVGGFHFHLFIPDYYENDASIRSSFGALVWRRIASLESAVCSISRDTCGTPTVRTIIR
jgi:hypothetical protein